MMRLQLSLLLYVVALLLCCRAGVATNEIEPAKTVHAVAEITGIQMIAGETTTSMTTESLPRGRHRRSKAPSMAPTSKAPKTSKAPINARKPDGSQRFNRMKAPSKSPSETGSSKGVKFSIKAPKPSKPPSPDAGKVQPLL